MLDLLRSRTHLHAAFERVRENAGCRGADGVTVGDFADNLEAELDALEASLAERRYFPVPLLEIPVAKPAGGLRRLAVPSVRDRVAQAAMLLLTREIFEQEMEEVSFAFRAGLGVRQAVARIAELRDQGFRFVVDADVAAFFDTIPHERLFKRLHRLPLPPYFFALFAHWVRAEIYDGKTLRRLDQGIPQGAVISPLLANLFLDPLDEAFARAGRQIVRYADDFLVLCRTESEAEASLELTDELLERLELDLNREKTVVTSFDQGFKFLGVLFVRDEVFLPFEGRKKERESPVLPPPLTLRCYLELRNAAFTVPAEWRA
jgi:group II intron reverse transcriptase/maturase